MLRRPIPTVPEAKFRSVLTKNLPALVPKIDRKLSNVESGGIACVTN